MKFVPYKKLSKKRQRELNNMKRHTWGNLNPVTRIPDDPKDYNRLKADKETQKLIDEHESD